MSPLNFYIKNVWISKTDELMFWIKIKKNRYTPVNHTFTYYVKVGYEVVYISRSCFPDGYANMIITSYEDGAPLWHDVYLQ